MNEQTRPESTIEILENSRVACVTFGNHEFWTELKGRRFPFSHLLEKNASYVVVSSGLNLYMFEASKVSVPEDVQIWKKPAANDPIAVGTVIETTVEKPYDGNQSVPIGTEGIVVQLYGDKFGVEFVDFDDFKTIFYVLSEIKRST